MAHEVQFSNRKALFLWGFTVVWLAALAMGTYVLYRDGFPVRSSPTLVLAVFGVFWLVGLCLFTYALSKPCISVAVDRQGRVKIVSLYPYRVVHRSLERKDLGFARVVVDRDTDGDPRFHARITIRDGEDIDFRQEHDRESCEQACMQFNLAVFGKAAAGARGVHSD